MSGDVTKGFLNKMFKFNNIIASQVGCSANASFSQASSTVLSNVGGMSVYLEAGAYVVDGYLAVTNGSSGGIKLNLNGGNATIGSALLDTWVYNTTTLTAESNINAIASNLVAATVAATVVFFGGTITVTKAGTVQLQAAQNASNSTATTVTNGSYITYNRIA